MSSLPAIPEASGIPPEALRAVEGLAPATTLAYRGVVKAFLEWASGGSISAELFAQWIAEELSKGVSAAKLNQQIAGGKAAILQAANRQGMAAREIALLKKALDSVKGVKRTRPRIDVVDGAQRRLILMQLEPHMHLVFRFLYATAARVSEALAVKETDIRIDMDRASIRLLGKGGKERWVSIPLDLLREINTAFNRPDRVYLFENRYGNRLSRQWVTREIGRASRIALGWVVSSHDLRHSRATDLFAKTGRLKAVSEYLGHAGIQTTAAFYVRDDLTTKDLTEGEEL